MPDTMMTSGLSATVSAAADCICQMKPFFKPGLAAGADSKFKCHAATVPSDAAENRALESVAKATPVMLPLVSVERCAQVARLSP